MSRNRSSRRRPPASRPRTVPPVHSLRRELTTKRRGELASLVFLLIATRMGFGVSKPYGDSERYDFILDSRDLTHKPRHPEERAFCATKDLGVPRDASRFLRGKNARLARIPCPPLYRVQVKCSTQLLNGLYRINGHHRSGRRAVPYLPCEIDFIAANIIPEDTWYIIPLHAVRGTSLLFRRKKDHRPGLYDQYRKPGTSSAASPAICVKRVKGPRTVWGRTMWGRAPSPVRRPRCIGPQPHG